MSTTTNGNGAPPRAPSPTTTEDDRSTPVWCPDIRRAVAEVLGGVPRHVAITVLGRTEAELDAAERTLRAAVAAQGGHVLPTGGAA